MVARTVSAPQSVPEPPTDDVSDASQPSLTTQYQIKGKVTDIVGRFEEGKTLDESAEEDYDIVTPSPDVVEEIVGDDVTCSSDVDEEEEVLDDGTVVRRTVRVVTHSRSVRRTQVVLGREEVEVVKRPVGTEVSETVVELPPGATSHDDDGLETETRRQQFSDTYDDGTWMRKTVTHIIAKRKSPPNETATGQVTQAAAENITQTHTSVLQASDVTTEASEDGDYPNIVSLRV